MDAKDYKPVPTLATLRVCPERDIECGSMPSSWCELCPKRNFKASSELLRRGTVAVDMPAVVHVEIQDSPHTDSVHVTLSESLADFEVRSAMVTNHLSHMRMLMARSDAFEKMKALLQGNQDGVLARLREIVEATP